MRRQTFVEIIALLFTVLFLYTGISKLLDYAVFKEQIATSPLLKPISSFIAIALPVVEFLIVSLLMMPRFRLRGLQAALTLMIMFTGYIVLMLIFNDKILCSCGGVLEELSWKQHIVFNSVFITLALSGILLQEKSTKAQPIKWVQ